MQQSEELKESEIIRVNIHRSLLDEFRIRKENYEKKLGYRINGGTPIISQICAEILKRDRENRKDRIIIEVHKIKGLKRIDTIFL
jgi:hypothetical protein